MHTQKIIRYLLLVSAVLYYVVPQFCSASLMLFDDKLRVKGTFYEFGTYLTAIKKVDRENRDHRIGLMKTKATLELLYNAVEDGDFNIKLFGFYQWWHDSVADFDGKYKRAIYSRIRHRYKGPYERADDWINEMYADIYKGPWNFRIGKQIVFWSEVEMVRTIDRINPLDMRYTTPGIDPWDEMKLGLWMVRGFYTSNLPGNLVFEVIWSPDFQRVRMPYEGTSLGSNPSPPGPRVPRAYGQNAAVNDDMFYKDQPSFKLSNSTFAFRIRGTSDVPILGTNYLIDWTLSWYHGMNTTPVPKSDTLGKPSYLNLNKKNLNGYMMSLALDRVMGKDLYHAPTGFWRYKFFDAIGLSGQSFIPSLKGVVRGEASYEIGLPEIKCYPPNVDSNPSYMKVMTGNTERDSFNLGITFDRPVRWNWLQEQMWLASSGIIETTFGWYAQWRLGDVDRVRRTFGYLHRYESNWTLTLRGNINHNALFPVVRFLYNERNWGYGVIACKYQPGRHMRYEAGWTWFFAKDNWDSREAYCENRDFIYCRVGYEF